MPVLPEFMPEGKPGEAADNFAQGRTEGESWMTMQQNRQMKERDMQIQEEQNRRAAALYTLSMPLQVAQTRAKTAAAENDYAGDLQMQGLMTQANQEMPNIRSAWKSTYQIPDEKARLDAQDQILSNASRYSSLKGVGDEIKQWHDVWAQGKVDQKTRDLISGRSEVAGMQAETRALIAQQQQVFQRQLEEQKASHQKEIEGLKGDINMKRDAAKATSFQNSAAFKIREGGAAKFNEELIKGAMSANYEKAQAERGLDLLEKARTGTGAEFENSVKRIGALFGGDTEGVKNFEQLQGILGNQIFDYIHRTKGSISDKEMATFKAYSASADKSPEGNKAILRALIKAKERDIELGDLVNGMRKEGDREADIQNAVVDYQSEHPLFGDTAAPSANAGESPSGVKILSIKRLD